MDNKLPPEIVVQDVWPSSMRWVLPRRELAAGRIIVWVLFVMGLVLLSMTVNFGLSLGGVMPWIFGRMLGGLAIMVLIPTLGGIIPLWWGAAGLWGHRELEIRGPWLRTVERVGPFWRSKRWKLARIDHFDVAAAVPPQSGQPPPKIFERYNALLAKFGSGQGMLAWGYPDELLWQLAAAVAERGNSYLEREGQTERIRVPHAFGKAADERADDNDELADDEDLDDDEDEYELTSGPLTQPTGSKIEIERFEGGLSIRVPAPGLRKGTSGLFFFSLIWNGFMGVFTSFAHFGLMQGKAKNEDLWILIPFLGLFWLIGIGILLGSLSMARRRAGIAIADGSLMVLQTGLFRSKSCEWPAGEVAAIRLDGSGMEVNGVPVLELQIHGKDGKKFGLLAGRGNEELEWLAWELRQSLGVPEHAATANS
jgi:hypothetical protein